MSLEETDQAAQAVQRTPNRVSLSDIENSIVRTQYIDGKTINRLWTDGNANPATAGQEQLDVFTLCIVQVQNGFVVLGKSAPADAENFNADLGRKFAYEDAVRQLWPLLGFALREKLAAQA